MLAGVKKWLNASSKARAHALYIALIAKARHPFFYALAGVPDTLDGRFEMILIHLFPVLDRLKRDPLGIEAARELTETYFSDMDRSLRELGVGDTGVSRRVRQMANACYGRLETYTKTVDDSEALKIALHRNVYVEATDIDNNTLAWLAEYVQQSYRRINMQSLEELLAGQPDFKNIETPKV